MVTLIPSKPYPLHPWQPLMRMVDARDVDIEMMMQQAVDRGVDTLFINSAGFIAWYPTALPYQRINPYLKGDFLGDVVEKAKKYNLQIYGRVDISKGFQEWFEEHPDWYAVDINGRPRRHWELYETCFTGPYYQEVNFQIVDELLSKYPLDGLFYNFYYFAKCHCPRCQSTFRDAVGIPVSEDDLHQPEYERWRHKMLAQYTGKLRSHIRMRGKEVRLVVYHHLQTGWDPRMMSKQVDIWSAQDCHPSILNHIDPQPSWIYWSAEEALKGKALKPENNPILFQTYSQIFSSRRVLQPADRLTTTFVQTVAYSGVPCLSLNGVLEHQEDNRPLARMAEEQNRSVKIRNYSEGSDIPADIVLINSPDTQWFGSDEASPNGTEYGHLREFRGLFTALTALRYPFKVEMAGALNPRQLKGYKVCILPAVSCLSKEDALALDRWVMEGGWVLATADTGIGNENGQSYHEPVCEIFSPILHGPISTIGGYLSFEKSSVEYVLGTTLVGISGPFWILEGDRGTSDLHLVGPFLNNSPEFTYWEEEKAGYPGLLRRNHGKGGIVQMPWHIGALYFKAAIPDYKEILAKILFDILGAPMIETDAPPSVEIVVRSNENEKGKIWFIYLINHTSTAGQPLTHTITLPPIKLKFPFPIKKAYLLVAGKQIETISCGNEYSEVYTEQLNTYEVLMLEAV